MFVVACERKHGCRLADDSILAQIALADIVNVSVLALGTGYRHGAERPCHTVI